MIFRIKYWSLFSMLIAIHIQAKNVCGVNQATKNMDEVFSEEKLEVVKREAIHGMLKNLQ